ncbi:MAG: transglutaminase-like cysteine peptidase [Alsobacter sp.]
MRNVWVSGLAACLAVVTGSAMAQDRGARILPAATTSAPVLDEVRPPIGWIEFCPLHPSDCDVEMRPARRIVLDGDAWRRIVRINQQVNAAIEQIEDIVLYGVSEKWSYPDAGKGDCEVIALLKRRMLMKEGFPRQALLMTVVRDETGAGHAILTLTTDRGDFILDSKTSRVLPWTETGYGFIKRQSAEHPNLWVRLGEPAAPGLIVAGQ